MALPSAWIDRIFERLELAYGHRFLSQWPGMSLDVVKRHWVEEMDGMEHHSDAIVWALQNLPADEPVNVLQFRALCRRAPTKQAPALPAPAVDRAKAKRAIEAAMQAFSSPRDLHTPVRTLMLRELEGDRQLTRAQRQFWRQCLQGELLRKFGVDCMLPGFDLDDLREAMARPVELAA